MLQVHAINDWVLESDSSEFDFGPTFAPGSSTTQLKRPATQGSVRVPFGLKASILRLC